jgi:predicted neutral ceramidase superfamily lipid hydrolase
MQAKDFQKLEYIVSPIYLLIIFFCLFFAFPMTEENSEWFFGLIILTFPWSMITFFMIMGAIHSGNSDQSGILYFISTSFINAYIIYYFVKVFKRSNNKIVTLEVSDFAGESFPVVENDKDNRLG